MKNILKQLESTNKPIYVELTDEASGKRFLAEAEAAGFRFGDGAKPTERAYGRVMALKSDRTICYLGICGHIAFGCSPATIGGRPALWLQYQNGASAPLPNAAYPGGNRL